jgi:hypothetical protein
MSWRSRICFLAVQASTRASHLMEVDDIVWVILHRPCQMLPKERVAQSWLGIKQALPPMSRIEHNWQVTRRCCNNPSSSPLTAAASFTSCCGLSSLSLSSFSCSCSTICCCLPPMNGKNVKSRANQPMFVCYASTSTIITILTELVLWLCFMTRASGFNSDDAMIPGMPSEHANLLYNTPTVSDKDVPPSTSCLFPMSTPSFILWCFTIYLILYLPRFERRFPRVVHPRGRGKWSSIWKLQRDTGGHYGWN